MNSEASSRQEDLELRLHGFKTNLIKESIRMGYNALGNFFYERGMLQVSDVKNISAPRFVHLN